MVCLVFTDLYLGRYCTMVSGPYILYTDPGLDLASSTFFSESDPDPELDLASGSGSSVRTGLVRIRD